MDSNFEFIIYQELFQADRARDSRTVEIINHKCLFDKRSFPTLLLEFVTEKHFLYIIIIVIVIIISNQAY